MDINLVDLLDSSQKRLISKALTEKILKEIEDLEFSKGRRIDLSSQINKILRELFSEDELDNFSHNLNHEKIGEALSEKFIEAIKRK